MNTKIEFYTDKRGKIRWRVTNVRNNKIIDSSSQGFATEQKARENLTLVAESLGEYLFPVK